MDDEGEGEDPLEELVAEAQAAAEAGELKDTGDAVVREYQEKQAKELAALRVQRIEELHPWTLARLSRLQEASPLWFGQSSSMEPGARPINIRWEQAAKRYIVLDFNSYRGSIRVWQLSDATGRDLGVAQVSREIDAAADDAEQQIEQALRWLWQQDAGPRP